MNTVERIPSSVEGFMEHINNIVEPQIFIFGADIAGKIVKKIFDELGVNVSGFIDNNKNKTDVVLDGVNVLHAGEFIKNQDKKVIVFIASTYISDIIRQLEDAGFYNWVPIMNFLNYYSEDIFRSLLKGDLRKNHSGGEFTNDFDIFVLDNMRNSQIKYLEEGNLYIRSVDIVITEKCSLKCHDCSNLMQYYEKPLNIEYEHVKNEIDNITDVADEINELRIIGGDAFMNKDFAAIVNYAASKENVNKVVIYTNGTIAPNIEKIKQISNSRKIFVFITTYGELSGNSEKLAQALTTFDIQFNKQPAYGWTDCGHIAKFERSDKERSVIFKNCCAKHFTTVTDNKVFRCPFAANLHRLKATPVFKDDFIELKDTKELDENGVLQYRENMSNYLNEVASIKYCDYCNGRTYGDPEITPGVQTKKILQYLKFER